MSSKACQTNSEACSREIINRVILSSVMGIDPLFLIRSKKGITEPLEPMTFPYLTTENLVPYSLE